MATTEGINRQNVLIGSFNSSHKCLKLDDCELSSATEDSIILLLSKPAGFSTVVVFLAVVEPSLFAINLVSVVALAVGLAEVVSNAASAAAGAVVVVVADFKETTRAAAAGVVDAAVGFLVVVEEVIFIFETVNLVGFPSAFFS